MKRILFVDDEPNVLQGLARMLRGMRQEWQMTFLSDPLEAVEALEQSEFDAIIVDMRMPRMDGGELLARAQARVPGMARIVLSGHAEREAALRTAGLAHQFIAKPCDSDTMRATVARVCELRQLLKRVGLADAVCKLGSLPSLPHLYHAMTEELSRPEPSLKNLASIVSHDVAMTAKVLQLVNSAFFGLGRRVASIEEAVTYIGAEVLRALVTSYSAFQAFENATDVKLFGDLWNHSQRTAVLAKTIVQRRYDDQVTRGETLQAGMLHDIGKLVLGTRFRDRYTQVVSRQGEDKLTAGSAELEVFGCDHAEIGAYLLGLWGFADRVVEAVAYHIEPSKCASRQFSALTAVHVASVLLDEVGGKSTERLLDREYLEEVGCFGDVDQWRAEAQRIVTLDGEAI
jgi:HD-like signal output (HDOD) protein/CheY-like chemotaxis protein